MSTPVREYIVSADGKRVRQIYWERVVQFKLWNVKTDEGENNQNCRERLMRYS